MVLFRKIGHPSRKDRLQSRDFSAGGSVLALLIVGMALFLL